MKTDRTIKRVWRAAAMAAVFLAASQAMAAPGDSANGERIYTGRCIMCHGEDGDGLGPAAERFNPPPRDFTLGQYKTKTSYFDDMISNDDDIFRMIANGMPGTVMPGWSDVLSDQDIWDLIAHLKTYAGVEEEVPEQQVDYGDPVAISEQSIAEGKRLFHEDDRCSECHGKDGKGDASKRLKDDNGERTWPRNLTKPWTFLASNQPKDIFSRIAVGIPGTQMPSFADPKNKKGLTIEERWQVANYVNSLAKTIEVVRPENTVVIAEKITAGLPGSPDDPRWADAAPSTFFLLPQLIAKDRFFTPSNDTITVRAVYNGQGIAWLVSWDDRTKSTPGDAKAEEISGPGLTRDAVAIQLPVELPEGAEKPYFAMGDSGHPVSLYLWKSETVDSAQSVAAMSARGFGDVERNDAGEAGLTASGTYSDGTWRVVFTRPLAASAPGLDIGIEEGAFIPIAFAAWDGSNSESGSKHTMTTWYWLLLRPDTGFGPLVIAFLIFGLIGGSELWWLRGAGGRGAGKS